MLFKKQETESGPILWFPAMANEPCYNQLRTNEQLGYIVASQVRRSNGTQGLKVLVQSNSHPSHVDSRIHAFLEEFRASL